MGRQKAIRYAVVFLVLGFLCTLVGRAPAQAGPLAEAKAILRTGDIAGAIAKANDLIASTQDRHIQAKAYLFIGYCYLKDRKADSAISTLDKVVTDYADQVDEATEAQYVKADTLYAAGKTAEARAAFSKVLEFKPSDPWHLVESHLRLVNMAYSEAKAGTGAHADAEQAANAALTAFSQYLHVRNRVRLAMAEGYLAQGKPLEAIEAVKAAMNVLPDMRFSYGLATLDAATSYSAFPAEEQVAWAKVRIANLRWAKGSGESGAGLEAFQQILQQYSAFPGPCAEAQYKIGEILMQERKVDAALAEFNKALQAYGTNKWLCAWATYRIGECYASRETPADREEAIKQLRRVAAEYSDVKMAFACSIFRLSKLVNQGDLDAAISELEKIDAGYPPEIVAAAKGCKLEVLLCQKKLQEAAALGRELVADANYFSSILSPRSKGCVQLEVAACLAVQKDYETAIAEAGKVASLPGGEDYAPQAQILIGDCHRSCGRTTEAVAAYRKCVTDWPDREELVAVARYRAAVCLYEAQQFADAKAEFEAFLADCSRYASGESISKANKYLVEIAAK